MFKDNFAKKDQKNNILRKFIMFSFAFLGLVALSIAIYIAMNSSDYAKQTAQPLEQALIAKGAVKKCETGDSGRGLDNKEPWYDATFELKSNKEDALKLIEQVAKDNGYTLTQATPENREPLGAVADQYLGAWQFDITSKQSPYSDLEPGQIHLAMSVNASGSDGTCGENSARIDDTHSSIVLSVELPLFR